MDNAWNFVFKEEQSKAYLYTYSGSSENEEIIQNEEGCVKTVEATEDAIKVTLGDEKVFQLQLSLFKANNIFSGVIGKGDTSENFVSKFENTLKASIDYSFGASSSKDVEESKSDTPLVECNIQNEPETNKKYCGQWTVDIENLQEPDDEFAPFRVRQINEERVNQLAQEFLGSIVLPWSGPPLHVMAIDVMDKVELMDKGIRNTKFVIIDGNHRYRGILKAQKLSGLKVHCQVPCLVYLQLLKEEALTIGCKGNKLSENVLVMTDYDKVKLFKAQFPSLTSDSVTRSVTEKDLITIYDIFDIQTRKEKLAFQPITNITKLSGRCWEIVKKKFDGNKDLKASTFNCLTGLVEETAFRGLEVLKDTNDVSKMKHFCKEKKISDKTTLNFEISDDVMKVSFGQKTLIGSMVRLKVNKEEHLMSSTDFKMFLEDSELMEKANHQTEKNLKRTSTEKMKKKTRGNDKEEIDIGSQDSMVKSQDKVKKGIKGDVNKKQKKILDRSEGLIEKQKKTTIEKNQEEIKDDGKELKSLVEKAKEIRKEIKEYMVNYKPCKSLPKVGDSILEEYVDTTKGISEEDRDDLTAYLCTFEELNFTVLDIPSMVHDTISFIIHHSDRKDINETVMPARKQEKRTIKKKIIYDPDDYQSPKKKNTQSSGGLGAMNMNYQQCSPTKEIKEKDFKLCEYPQNLETGQWVLVRPNKSEDEENIPWVGEVTKVTSTHIYFDWCEGDFGQDWQSGTLIPKSDKTTTDNILASFEWDYVNLKKMPDGLQTQLKLIWDS